jgi:c-di-GMP-binding flagellar brake protein YcgR
MKKNTMTSEDKRKHERIQSLNLSYICLDEDQNIVKQGMGRTLNISESGILLETHFPIETSHIVQMTIGLEEDLLDITGKPVHIKAGEKGKYEIGIQFVQLDQRSSRVLRKFISAGGIRKDPLIEVEE